MWQGYFGIENLALNDAQRAELVAALRALGPSSDPQPARLNHWRTRPDAQAAIFEALFNKDHITIQTFKNRLGAIFNVDPATINHAIAFHTFATLPTAVVTFSRGGTNYLRVAFFGYDGAYWPTWDESGDEARAYWHFIVTCGSRASDRLGAVCGGCWGGCCGACPAVADPRMAAAHGAVDAMTALLLALFVLACIAVSRWRRTRWVDGEYRDG